jgi:hypothetical protein
MLKLGAYDRAQLVAFAFHAGPAVSRTRAAAPQRPGAGTGVMTTSSVISRHKPNRAGVGDAGPVVRGLTLVDAAARSRARAGDHVARR